MAEISYQLYSSRAFGPLAETLAMLKELGYGQVEGYGGLYDDLPGLAEALKTAGLTMPTGHFGLDMLEKEPSRVLEIAEAVGMHAVYCPYLEADRRPRDAEGWRDFGKRLQQAGRPLRDTGLVFGWHNHDYELRRLRDGSVALDAIFEGGPELSWQADLAWIARGGGDPCYWIGRHGGRITAVHVKDIAPDGACGDEDGWADVGHGVMDWKSIRKVLGATPCRYFIVEHDRPNDDRRFAARSIAALRAL